MAAEQGRLIAGRYRLGRLLGHKEYFVQLTALSASWDRSQPIFRAFFATFRPAS